MPVPSSSNGMLTGALKTPRKPRVPNTTADANAEYLARRVLPEPFAGNWDLWGFIVGLALAGAFAGWQTGINYGSANMIAAFILSSVLYLALSVSVAELASALPFASGPAAFAQAAFNTGTGAFTGILYAVSYLMLGAQSMVLLATTVQTVVSDSVNIPSYGWWILISVVAIVIEWSPKVFFRTTLVLAVYSCALVVAYAGAMAGMGQNAYVSAPNGADAAWTPESSSTCSAANANDLTAGLSFKGITLAFPFASWLYLGIEAFPVTAEETTSNLYAGRLPKAVMYAFVTLAVIGVVCLVTAPTVYDPYLATFIITDHPLVDRVVRLVCARLPDTAIVPGDICDPASVVDGLFVSPAGPITSAVIALAVLPPQFASLLACTYAATRHIYTLSRMGVFPTKISLTTKPGSPVYAMLLTCVLQVAVTVLIQTGYAVAAASASDNTSDCLTGDALLAVNILKVSAWFSYATYAFVLAAFMVVQWRLPTLPRPFRSPLGNIGAAVGAAIALTFGVIGPLATSLDDFFFYATLTGITAAIIVTFGIYWRLVAKKRSALSPERIFVRRQLKKLWDHEMKWSSASGEGHSHHDHGPTSSHIGSMLTTTDHQHHTFTKTAEHGHLSVHPTATVLLSNQRTSISDSSTGSRS
ncbi:amino acid permease-domain-containing protein [Blastocladiella britannica]|nr:amino acid permease-domain-containing protein [Blastocladiella britannica]